MSIPLVTLRNDGSVGILTICNPPVNALSMAVVCEMDECFTAFESQSHLTALVVHCEGSTFVAGGDIAELESSAFSTKPLNNLLARLEACSRPVIAALHGTALGGGLELAMACHWRVATPGTRIGLPEVKLGLIPGSLGTQRLPRLAGGAFALDLMLTGRTLDAARALSAGIVDEVSELPSLQGALVRAHALVQQHWVPRRASKLALDPTKLTNEVLDKARAQAKLRSHYPAHEAIFECVRAASLPFVEGEQVEARWFTQVLHSPTSKAMRHLFFAERLAKKHPGLKGGGRLRPIRKVGVLGAGTMGCGIVMTFLNAGFETVLVEASSDALEHGVATIGKNYDSTVSKGKLAPEDRERRLARLTSSLDDSALADCDIVVEAVFENMALKLQIARRLGELCKPDAIIATNTSTLDVNAIAVASGRPDAVVGTHFFSPANVMRLLEVIRGDRTAPDVLATVTQLAKCIGKIAVVSGVCYGFIGNRMSEVYMREAEFLLLEGATPSQVDAAIEGLGFAMGPCRMLDMAGIDVGAKTVIEYGKAGGLPPDPTYRAVVRKLFELGQFGQKTGAGYYRYDGRIPIPNPDTLATCVTLSEQHGFARRSNIADEEIVERLIYCMVNEGARILEEGIACRGSDIDVVWTAGYGFPSHQGGPMYFADAHGLAHVVERLDHYAATRGNPFGYWDVSPLLRRLAGDGARISTYAA